MTDDCDVWFDGEWSEKYLGFGHIDAAEFVAAAAAIEHLDHDGEELRESDVLHRWMRWSDTEPHERFVTVRGTCFGAAHPYTEMWP